MKIQSTILSIILLAFFPMAAGAQGFNNININLNDVMVSQRQQEMSQRLDEYNAGSVLGVKKHHDKRDKKNKNHQVALLHNESLTANPDNTAGTVNSVAPATGDTAQDVAH